VRREERGVMQEDMGRGGLAGGVDMKTRGSLRVPGVLNAVVVGEMVRVRVRRILR